MTNMDEFAIAIGYSVMVGAGIFTAAFIVIVGALAVNRAYWRTIEAAGDFRIWNEFRHWYSAKHAAKAEGREDGNG